MGAQANGLIALPHHGASRWRVARPLEGGDDLFLSAREMYQVFDGDEVLVSMAGVDGAAALRVRWLRY